MVSPVKLIIPIVIVAIVVIAVLLVLTTKPGGAGNETGRAPTTVTTPTVTTTPTETTIRIRPSFISIVKVGDLVLNDETKQLMIELNVRAKNVTLLGTVDLSISVGNEQIERKGIKLPDEYVNKTIVGEQSLSIKFVVEVSEKEAATLSARTGMSVLVNVTIYCINIVEGKPEAYYPRTPLYATIRVVTGTETGVTETIETTPIRPPRQPGAW